MVRYNVWVVCCVTWALHFIFAMIIDCTLEVTPPPVDLFDDESPLPECDVVVAADLLYNAPLTKAVARTCARLRAEQRCTVIVTDSQLHMRETFLEEFSRCENSTPRVFKSMGIKEILLK